MRILKRIGEIALAIGAFTLFACYMLLMRLADFLTEIIQCIFRRG